MWAGQFVKIPVPEARWHTEVNGLGVDLKPELRAWLKSCKAASVVPSPIQEECELRGL